jgi:D-alanine--poly(phosphoribitol) ligase subunit 2
MIEKKTVLQTIYNVVDEMNMELPEEQLMEKSKDFVLFGRSGKLDSLGLVTFIVAVEQKFQEDLGVTITLADERAMSQKRSPFATIETLADYTFNLLKENADG